jgi:hypothetical protein
MTFNFPTPVPITAGLVYYIAGCCDVSSGTFQIYTPVLGGLVGGAAFATFPVANPTGLTSTAAFTVFTAINITPSSGEVNAPFVADPRQDGLNSYIASSTNGQSDLYALAPIPARPVSILAVTTRALVQKADAGTRNVAVQLKSGPALVQGPSQPMPAATWQWLERTDMVDPNTGTTWASAAVDAAQIGIQVTA